MGFLTILARSAASLALTLGGGGHASRQPAATAALPDTGQITVQMINAGRGIFHNQGGCFVCHGANLQGSPVAPPLDKEGKPWVAAKGGTFPQIFYIVTHGVAGTVMVSHPNGINDELATEVAAYIWAVNHRGVKP